MASSSKAEPTNGLLDIIDPEVIESIKQIEAEFEEAEKINLRHRIKLMRPIFSRRRGILEKIPQFWPQTLVKHSVAAQYLEYDDYEIIQYLTDLYVEREEEILDNYKIVLKFSVNPYIKNLELIKEYYNDDAGHLRTRSTKIEWHDGKDFTKKRKPEDEEQSFLKWFTSESPQDGEGWDLGKIIRDELFPNAYQFFQLDEDPELEEEIDLDEYGEDEEPDEDGPKIPPNKRNKEK